MDRLGNVEKMDNFQFQAVNVQPILDVSRYRALQVLGKELQQIGKCLGKENNVVMLGEPGIGVSNKKITVRRNGFTKKINHLTMELKKLAKSWWNCRRPWKGL